MYAYVSTNSNDSLFTSISRRHQTASVSTPFVSIERKLKRWKAETHPPQPKDLAQYTNQMAEDRWKREYLKYESGELDLVTVETEQGEYVTLFGDRQLIDSLSGIHDLAADATFDVCPKTMKVTQLLTIMARVNGVVSICIIGKQILIMYVSHIFALF